jgi:hypothetical protein
MMRYERMVARIGKKLPHLFRVEWKNSVVIDGIPLGVVTSKSEAALELSFPLGVDAVAWSST